MSGVMAASWRVLPLDAPRHLPSSDTRTKAETILMMQQSHLSDTRIMADKILMMQQSHLSDTRTRAVASRTCRLCKNLGPHDVCVYNCGTMADSLYDCTPRHIPYKFLVSQLADVCLNTAAFKAMP
eukprot:jgi/Ulvmu1/2070/UM123_0002.1